MSKPRFSLKSTHLLMWSSPLLLLVLVFTLTTSNKVMPAKDHRVTLSANVATTLVHTPMTTTTTTPSTTTTSTPPRSSPATTNAPSARSTASIVRRTVTTVAPTPGANVSNDDLEGLISPSLGGADIPLTGPGDWQLTTSSPSTNLLTCNGVTRAVQNYFALQNQLSCQLVITSANAGASLTWQLIPAP